MTTEPTYYRLTIRKELGHDPTLIEEPLKTSLSLAHLTDRVYGCGFPGEDTALWIYVTPENLKRGRTMLFRKAILRIKIAKAKYDRMIAKLFLMELGT